MITPVNILLIIIWALIVPFLLGSLISHGTEGKNGIRIGANIVYGFAVMCAVFQLMAVPMILLKIPFHVVKLGFIVICLLLSVLAILLMIKKGRTGQKLETSSFIKTITSDKVTLLIWIMAIVIIVFEALLLTFRMHIDTDDSRFLAEALEAVEKNTMLLHHPITGHFYNVPAGEQVKDITAPYPIFLGLIGELFSMHPTIAAHSVLPMLYIPLCYVVLNIISGYFFPGNIRARGIFMLFMATMYLFAFETIYSAGYTLLTIIWQGRSVVAMIMLPLAWYILMRMMSSEKITGWMYIVLFIVLIANAMLSNMGALFSVLLALAYFAVIIIKNRSVNQLVLMILILIPNGLYIVADKLFFNGILYR